MVVEGELEISDFGDHLHETFVSGGSEVVDQRSDVQVRHRVVFGIREEGYTAVQVVQEFVVVYQLLGVKVYDYDFPFRSNTAHEFYNRGDFNQWISPVWYFVNFL